MLSRRVAIGLIILLTAGSIVQNAFYWNHLPERVATHFNAQGEPDAWMNRTAATAMMLGFQLGIPLFVLMMAWLASSLPSSMVNIPHREYWLAPERREPTLRYMRDCMAWIAVLTSIFMMSINHLTFMANRDVASLPLAPFLALMAAFLVAVFAVVGCLVRHFRIPRQVA